MTARSSSQIDATMVSQIPAMEGTRSACRARRLPWAKSSMVCLAQMNEIAGCLIERRQDQVVRQFTEVVGRFTEQKYCVQAAESLLTALDQVAQLAIAEDVVHRTASAAWSALVGASRRARNSSISRLS